MNQETKAILAQEAPRGNQVRMEQKDAKVCQDQQVQKASLGRSEILVIAANRGYLEALGSVPSATPGIQESQGHRDRKVSVEDQARKEIVDPLEYPE